MKSVGVYHNFAALCFKTKNIKILDCRSPSEYIEDHPLDAMNTPVLNDSERERVGIIYKKHRFEAKKLGAQLITHNISKILENFNFPQNQEFLIYCARGGQRSQSLATILDKIGYRVSILDKGYKTYRSSVIDYLQSFKLPHKLNVIYGKTGTGKTLLLRHIRENGGQVLDLEELASHRGSILGSLPGVRKPSQKQFESNLYWTLNGLDLTKPIFVEGESKYVGRVAIPEILWKEMNSSNKIYVELDDFHERVKFIRHEYSHFEQGGKEELRQSLDVLKKPNLKKYLDVGDWDSLVGELLNGHYDPLYQKQISDCHHKYHISNISDHAELAKTLIKQHQ